MTKPEISPEMAQALADMVRAAVLRNDPDFDGDIDMTLCRHRQPAAKPKDDFFYMPQPGGIS